MRKNRLIILLAAILLIALGILLTACNPTDSISTDPQDQDKTKTNLEGWNKITNVDQKEMYKGLLLGFTSVASEFSNEKIAKNKTVTLDSKVGIKLNGIDLWLFVKGKYDGTDKSKVREYAIASVELSNKETMTNESKLIGLYLFRDNLYILLGAGSKVKFSLAKSNWTDYFPYDFPDITNRIGNIASLLPQYIRLDKIEGQKRYYNNNDEYKYSVEVNMQQTIIGLCNGLNEMAKQNGINQDAINKAIEFIAGVFGITVDELKRGEITDSSLKLDFEISGNKIHNLNMKIKMALGEDAQHLFSSEDLELELQISDVEFSKDYNNGVSIPFVNQKATELQSYKSYSEAIYYMQIPIKIFGNDFEILSDNHCLRIMTKVFQDDRDNNFFMCDYYNKTDNAVERGIYVYENKAYVFAQKNDGEDAECVYAFDINISDLATNIITNNLGGQSTLEVYDIVAYFLKNFSLSSSAVSLAINETFFEKVWYNFYDMIGYINNCTEDDITQNNDITEFVNFVTDNNVILTFGYNDVNLLNVLTDDDEILQQLIAKLQAVDLTQFEHGFESEESDDEELQNNE